MDLGMGITWPDIPLPSLGEAEGLIKDKVIEILNRMGYEWPTTDEGVLRQWAGEWSALQGPLDGFVSDMDGGVAHIEGNNTGPGTEAFVAFMHSEESGLESIRNLALAAPRVAAGYEAAALVVEALRIGYAMRWSEEFNR